MADNKLKYKDDKKEKIDLERKLPVSDLHVPMPKVKPPKDSNEPKDTKPSNSNKPLSNEKKSK